MGFVGSPLPRARDVAGHPGEPERALRRREGMGEEAEAHEGHAQDAEHLGVGRPARAGAHVGAALGHAEETPAVAEAQCEREDEEGAGQEEDAPLAEEGGVHERHDEGLVRRLAGEAPQQQAELDRRTRRQHDLVQAVWLTQAHEEGGQEGQGDAGVEETVHFLQIN